MRDYTFYIAASYGITAFVLIVAIVWLVFKRRRILQALKRMQHRQTKLEKRKQ